MNTDNPICDLSDYKQIVRTYLPKLKQLDGEKVLDMDKENDNTNKEPMLVHKPLTGNFIIIIKLSNS